ncbi:hypothetical protein [Falsiroseomonas sp.]|uniref:hypothetical protein n=1 Tax=Falsiroseomonas sp. TaxID=2870721 RepID=UPI0027231961|nr:hypothetical protein [Falsiroseomonas sp.]MDO9499112.1 hypothetical protein [Falsiroseomonas sp.]
MPRRPPIRSTLTPAERDAWDFILAFARARAAAIVATGWREDVTDIVLSEILSAPHLLAQYLLAIGAADPHVHGSRRKRLLDQQIGRACRAATNGLVRVVDGKRVMRDASVGPHFRFTVLDAPLGAPFVPPRP